MCTLTSRKVLITRLSKLLLFLKDYLMILLVALYMTINNKLINLFFLIIIFQQSGQQVIKQDNVENCFHVLGCICQHRKKTAGDVNLTITLLQGFTQLKLKHNKHILEFLICRLIIFVVVVRILTDIFQLSKFDF